MPHVSQLTDQELEALKECSFESFFRRSLPLMSIFGGGTYVLIRLGKLNPHYKWGAAPKVLIACTIAYFVGQFSYQRKCHEKFMRIPDSKIGELLREQERGEPFSSEEMRVLQECNKESFYQRCLPLSTVLGIGTFMGVKSGFLQPSPRFGASPKVIGAVILGYLVGKITYQGKCAEKLMALPDSKIGAILRNKRLGVSQQNSLTIEDQDLENVVTGIPDSEKFSDISNRSIMDLDIDRPMMSAGIDDFRPNVDDIRVEDDTLLPRDISGTSSYDDLRRRNREGYEQKRTKPYRGVITPEEVPTALNPSDQRPSGGPPRPSNIYGDLWEK